MKKWLLGLAIVAAALAGLWRFYPDQFARYAALVLPARQGEANNQRAARPRRESEAVPVLAEAVQRRDVPIFRDGIGNVQAYAAITVRAQVDGKLLAVEFKEGQDVKKGDVLARIDPAIYQAQLDAASAKKAQNEANLANMRLDLERYERLAATNAGSKQQADGQRAMVAQMEAQLRADQAAIDNARIVLDFTLVRAPIDGRTGLRQVDPGNIIRASDANGLVMIAQVSPIAVLFTLPQRDFALVSDAMKAGQVPVEALDSDGRTVLGKGTLEVVDNLIDTATGTFKLKAVFPNEARRMWPGQFVTAHVLVASLKEAIVVPVAAVRRGPDSTFVYLAQGEKAVIRKVEIALQTDEVAVIPNGLKPGDRVITAGFARLADGKPISLPEAQPGEETNGVKRQRDGPAPALPPLGQSAQPAGQRS